VRRDGQNGHAATTYPPVQAFDFTLTLLGRAVDFLPHLILAFRGWLARASPEFSSVTCMGHKKM
jgi:hypothetical protein